MRRCGLLRASWTQSRRWFQINSRSQKSHHGLRFGPWMKKFWLCDTAWSGQAINNIHQYTSSTWVQVSPSSVICLLKKLRINTLVPGSLQEWCIMGVNNWRQVTKSKCTSDFRVVWDLVQTENVRDTRLHAQKKACRGPASFVTWLAKSWSLKSSTAYTLWPEMVTIFARRCRQQLHIGSSMHHSDGANNRENN